MRIKNLPKRPAWAPPLTSTTLALRAGPGVPGRPVLHAHADRGRRLGGGGEREVSKERFELISAKLNEVIYELRRINEAIYELKGAIQDLKYERR